ncbi:hypothetical protein D9M71_214010 [compost metagenome]
MGRQFLEGRTDPAEAVVLAQHFIRHFLHGLQRLAGAVARRRPAQHLGRRVDVEARVGIRAEDAFHPHQRGQRHQVVGGRAHVDLAEVIRLAAELRLGLQAHLPGAPVEGEVVDVVAAEGGLHGGEYIVDRHPQGTRLGAVEVDVVLRHVGVEGGVHPRQLGPLGGRGDELLHHGFQLLHGAAAAILDIGLEAAGGAHAGDRRRVERHHDAVLLPGAHLHEGARQVARIKFRRGALAPVLQRHEGHPGVAAGTEGEDVETGEGDHVLHRRVLHQFLGDRAGEFFGAGQRRRWRQEVGVEHIALVLVRHQRAGHPPEEDDQQCDHPAEQRQANQRTLEEELHPGAIAIGHALEEAVEPAERRRRLSMGGLEHQGAEGRRQGQRDDAGNHHRYRNGDRELLVHLPRQAAEEAHRDEHRTEHQHDGDDRPGHLLHGLDGRFARADLLGRHHPLDVLDHHDGVVDHDADGQHHAEQRQQVDGESEHVHAGEGAHQGHGDRQHRDQGGAPVLQEDEHYQHHQQQGFEKGLDHFLDGDLDEFGGVVGDLVGDALGEALGQPLHG